MAGHSLFHRTCLKPSYSLRRQLLLSFGSAALVTLLIVVTTACLTSFIAGGKVKGLADSLLREQVVRRLVRNQRYVSDTISTYFEKMEGSIQLTREMVQDRIVGYPDPGWEEDLFVPFRDRETGTNRYPLKATPLPLDWQFEVNINDDNVQEHFPDKPHILKVFDHLTASIPFYYMQGSCDPSQTNQTHPSYYKNCTDANNDIATGGVLNPTPTNKGLYEKAADIGVLLKPIFEAEKEITAVNLFFSNSGASSILQYPAGNAGVMLSPYESAGCDWMRDINPRNGKPYGTEEEIRRCRPAGEWVQPREYNPNEREWFPAMATNPGISWQGPLRANALPVFLVGTGIFDRITGNLIGTVALLIEAETLDKIIRSSAVDDHRAEMSIIRYKDDTVFADTLGSGGAIQKVTDTGFISEKNLDELRRVMDFTAEWTPEGFQESIEANLIVCDETATSYTAYPLPPLPDEYNADYEPEYLLIRAVANDVFDLSNVNDDIENAIVQTFLVSFVIGAFGMALVLVIVWFVSRGLTKPLLWMKQVAWGIVNHADERSVTSFTSPDYPEPALSSSGCCPPSTEVTELVREFKKMICGFSGKNAATLAHRDIFEIPNQLTWQSEYQQLYSYSSKAIDDKSVRLSSEDSEDGLVDQSSPETPIAGDGRDESDRASPVAIVLAPPKKNRGANVLVVESDYQVKKRLNSQYGGGYRMRAHRSSLFLWILFLIVLPLILTNTMICWVVSDRILYSMEDFVHVVGVQSLVLEDKALQSSAGLKAIKATISTSVFVRDLYVMTRFAGWLFFGGISRSDGFSNVVEAAQECRFYSSESLCPVYSDFERTPCACQWDDLNGVQCLEINYTDPRFLQEKFFFCQARDADNITGSRDEAASFGLEGIDDSPSTTLFWDDVDTVPGAAKGLNASGYETTYDRIRVSSAMSIVEIPMYNYATELGRAKHFIASSVAFDADGMMSGYRGCQPSHFVASHFKSDAVNRAASIDPKLCPLGKYGYDPRCRDWYTTGRQLYQDSGRPMHITAPYLSANLEFSATATSPIANPETQEYVGQMLLDFFPSSLSSIFKGVDEPLAFVITPHDGGTGDDTVIGPDRLHSWEPAPIIDLLFQYDEKSSRYRNDFATEILSRMKNGESGYDTFVRTTQSGSTETLKLAFEPVEARALVPLDPSEFSRGVNRSDILVYSVGVAYRADDFELPWQKIEDDLSDDLKRLRIIYLCIIGFVSVGFMVFTCIIAMNITKPVITLLSIVRSINARSIEDDIPPLQGGSSEVQQVYNSFSKLYKIVRISNFAFFSGNFAFAYRIINEALGLYRKIGDTKAIGIACNNLGNTLHAMCSNAHGGESNRLDGRLPLDCCERLPGECIVKMAKERYDEAISIARSQLALASSDEQKADFTQQLADRLFNRCLFLLLVADEACAPEDSRQTALSDIEQVRQMDYELKEFWLERKLLLQRSSDYFYRLLRRCSGLLDFYSDDELREIWNPTELVEDADRFLFAAWDQPMAPLFEQISRIGRLQQLECVAMQLDICRGRQILAARLAMRMFAEDEYLLESSFAVSASVLLNLIRDDDDWPGGWTSKTKAVRADLRKMLRRCKETRLDIGKCLVFAVELNDRWRGDPMLEMVNVRCLQLYDDCCMNDDFMGLVACTNQGDLNVLISIKAENEGRQRTSLDLATSTTSKQVSPAFPYALQMLIDSNEAPENDTFVVLLTDGFSWDSSTPATFKAQIDGMNRDRETKVHVVILGMEIEDTAVKEQCKSMCSVSKQSLYLDVDQSNIDHAMDLISALIRGETMTGVRLHLHGVTMEKF